MVAFARRARPTRRAGWKPALRKPQVRQQMRCAALVAGDVSGRWNHLQKANMWHPPPACAKTKADPSNFVNARKLLMTLRPPRSS
jgi:hypothetical protein